MSEEVKQKKIIKTKFLVTSGCLFWLIGFFLIMAGCSKCQDTSGAHWHKAEPFINAGFFFSLVGVVMLLIILIVHLFKDVQRSKDFQRSKKNNP